MLFSSFPVSLFISRDAGKPKRRAAGKPGAFDLLSTGKKQVCLTPSVIFLYRIPDKSLLHIRDKDHG